MPPRTRPSTAWTTEATRCSRCSRSSASTTSTCAGSPRTTACGRARSTRARTSSRCASWSTCARRSTRPRARPPSRRCASPGSSCRQPPPPKSPDSPDYPRFGVEVGPVRPDYPDLALSARGRPLRRALFRQVLERHVELHAIARDFAVLDRQVLLHHLGHAQVAQRLGCGLHGEPRRRLPRLVAGPDQLRHPIDAVSHDDLLLKTRARTPHSRAARTFSRRLSSLSRPILASCVQRSSCIASKVSTTRTPSSASCSSMTVSTLYGSTPGMKSATSSYARRRGGSTSLYVSLCSVNRGMPAR